MNKVIPVTILTGFLGSGKTTLLNHILKNNAGHKIAVIENEYGEESIDSELLEGSIEELIEIKDGCMCCVVRGDLIKGVQELLDSGKEIDYLIIEASGMSEPLPVAQTFMMEDFGGRTRLDSIVCVVDAENFHHQVVQSLHTTFEQIENSHFIVLNKVEKMNTVKLDEIKTSMRKLNPHSAIIESNYCEVDMDCLLDTQLFGEKSIQHKHEESTHSHNHHSHTHDKKQMQKYFFKTSTPCSHVENVKQFLSEISENIFRIKGFLYFRDFPGKRYILQKAGACFTLREDENWNGEGNESKIVFIGKNIEGEALQNILLRDVFFT